MSENNNENSKDQQENSPQQTPSPSLPNKNDDADDDLQPSCLKKNEDSALKNQNSQNGFDLNPEKIEELRRQTEYLRYYDELRIVYDNTGMSLLQTVLIKAFTQYLLDQNPQFQRMQVLKYIALMSNQMMMREFEILIWASINTRDLLDEVLLEKDSQKQMLYRLLMTAFYLKEKLCGKEEFEAIKAFFGLNFPQFLGKYTTEWLLLAEPDLSRINPMTLNQKFVELRQIYDKMVYIENPNEEEQDDQCKDYNHLVEELGEEMQRIDQLRKQQIEKEEKRNKQRKRLHSQIEKKQKEEAELQEQMKRQKSDIYEIGPSGMIGKYDDMNSPNKSLNTSFAGIGLFSSQIYGRSMYQQMNINQQNLQNSHSMLDLQKGGDILPDNENHSLKSNLVGEAQSILRITSGIYNMHELFHQLNMGHGDMQNEASFGFDQPLRDTSRMSMFNPDILAMVQKMDSRFGGDSLFGGMKQEGGLDKSGSFYLPIKYPSKSGLTPKK